MMQIAYEILNLLSDGKFHSGTRLAEKLKVSRASIWKGVDFLRNLPLTIDAVSGRGYRWRSPIELLNQHSILSTLKPEIQRSVPRLDLVNLIPSTNDYLIQRLPHAIPNGMLCIAEGQTAGKGRMGRQWFSPFGANIYLSLYRRSKAKLQDLFGLSLVVGLAVLESLKQMAPLPEGLGIKWPNDIWYRDAKLCGILIESLPCRRKTDPKWQTELVIGIGINVGMQANEPSLPSWTDLCSIFGFRPSRNALIGHLLNELIPMLNRFEEQGLSVFKELWLHYDLLIGKKVLLSTVHSSEKGIAEGINERGELCVRVGEMLKAVRSGDVSVRPD